MKTLCAALCVALSPFLLTAQLFSPAVEISDHLAEPHDVASLDIDEDGDLDLVVVSGIDNKVCWYPNVGAQQFGRQVVIGTEIDNPTDVSLADVDGDGRQDLIILTNTYHSALGQLYWQRNLGLGQFEPAVLITDGLTLAPTLLLGDWDADGITDIGLYQGDDHLSMHIYDDTSDTFAATQLFSELLSDCIPAVYDMDADGDDDIIVGHRTDREIHILLNDGSGGYLQSVLIGEPLQEPRQLLAGQFAGTPDIDVLVTRPGEGAVILVGQDQTYTTMTSFGAPYGRIEPIDIDGDGDLDIAGIGGDGDSFYLAESVGNGAFSYEAQSTAWVGNFTIADFDNDGMSEIILAIAGDGYYELPKVVWQESGEVIGNYDSAPSAWVSGDFTGDGFSDLITLSNFEIRLALYRNLGAGDFAPAEVLSTSTGFPYSGNDGAQGLSAADMDGDGDLDLVMISYDIAGLCWMENDGSGQFIATHCIGQSTPGRRIATVELDADSGIDVLFTTSDYDTDASELNTRLLLNDGKGDLNQSHHLKR